MEQKTKLKLVIFSDIHYADEIPSPTDSSTTIKRDEGFLETEKKLIHLAVPVLNKLIDKINNEIKPDVAINLGDLIEDFDNREQDIDNLKYIWSLLKNIDAQFYSVAGNHDLRSMHSRKEVEDIMGYNHSTYSVDINGYHLVFIGNDIREEYGNFEGGIFKTQFISEEDLKWLEKDLKQNNLPSLIFTHFGVAEDEMKGNWWFENLPEAALLGNRNDLKKILKQDKNLLGVFSGHQHWTKRITEDGIDYHVIGALIENINNDGIPDGVYFEVELEGHNIKVSKNHVKL